VAFSKLLRSSTKAVCRRPKREPVEGMNCHSPEAAAHERAVGRHALST
jgi:hypothetical protein